ncbi:MAG: alanine--tRNA ligase [Parabacteroides sp.]
MLTAKEIRESFKDFFASKGHTIVPSAPMVVKGDPTLMFTNAGMNQWKDIILGTHEPEPRRRADSQKCLRVSGKHNDLEEVGHDTYHHTMFEMLGNWSFGDYFKEGAIDMAWEYLVDVLHLDPADLYVTVFEGSAEENLQRDDEAAGYWLKHVPADHIINGNKHDNFWEMGDTGPCGPCSEIHLDSRKPEEKAKVPGRELVNKDDPQVIEIWNIVFMQYNRKADGSLEPLSMNVIDTGMGFERLVRALQGKHSNYDTDIFQPTIKEIGRLSGKTYGEAEPVDVAMRVIADHLRAVAFSIADGQLPSNAKAGYVIRRILRRAVRYGYTFLGQKEAFMYKLLPVLIETMGDAYPELIAQKTLIEKVIKEEEEAFLRTLETGIRLLDKKMEETKAEGKQVLNGVDAFTLYDTYGFPLDLTELILREKGMEVDIEEFNKEMQKQKERARNAAAIETGDWVHLKSGESKFVGYDLFECDAEIVSYRQVKQKNKVLYQVVLDQTPFYAEMGGQVGDTGWLIYEDERIEVIDTKRENNLPIHFVAKLPKDVTAPCVAKINAQKRIQCECNHSATHLLHEALREVLGTHVEQKGSYVSPDSLRFDFSHFQKVTDEEIRKVEILVGQKIRANYPLEEHRSMPIAEAKALGAMALFGEKYGDHVRVVKYGSSIELCGGTHIPATGMIGSLRIIGESSIAAGVRRIEAVTAEAAENFVFFQQDLIRELRAMMNNMPNLAQAVRKSIEENAEMKKQLESYVQEKAARLKEEIVAKAEESKGIKVFQYAGKGTTEILKNIAFQVKAETEGTFVFMAGILEGQKCSLMLMLSDDLVKFSGLNAGKIVREAAKHIQGGGGGQPHFATAGGKNPDGLSIALGAIKEALGI